MMLSERKDSFNDIIFVDSLKGGKLGSSFIKMCQNTPAALLGGASLTYR